MIQIRIDIEGKAMHCDFSLDSQPDGCDFIIPHPDPPVFIIALCLNTVLSVKKADKDVLQVEYKLFNPAGKG
jgi:hypothetical protein